MMSTLPNFRALACSPPTVSGDVQADMLQALQIEALSAIAQQRPMRETVRRLCRRVEALAPGLVCSVTVMRDGMLHLLAAPSWPRSLASTLAAAPVGETAPSGLATLTGHPVAAMEDPMRRAQATLNVPWLQACHSIPLRDGRGARLGTLAVHGSGPLSGVQQSLVDTTAQLCALVVERSRAWTRLEQRSDLFELALGHMSQGLSIFDAKQRLIVANGRYAEIYRLSPGSVRPGMTLREIVALRIAAGSEPMIGTEKYLALQARAERARAAADTVVQLTDGRFVTIHHEFTADKGWVATHEDITERCRAEAQIVHLARHDALTMLPNRSYFRRSLTRTLSRATADQPGALLCIDLDRFKPVNDIFGHPTGDSLLQDVAERLRGCARTGDVVARLGGDEFAMLLPQMSRTEDAAVVARRIIEALGAPFEIDGQRLGIGATIGIALAPADGATAAILLKAADAALCRAKAEQRGSFRFFEPGMDHRLQARAALEQDLRAAIDEEAFSLAYQPLYDLRTERLCGFEALLRWTHPTRGDVPPNVMVPIAEETRLILSLGAWVLRQACAEAANWPDAVRVAVNLSAVQFTDETLLSTVQDALRRSGLPPRRLELEITESVLLGKNPAVLETLHALRTMGVRIALDDFGTGYSSLGYLRSFPFDKIKIDQSFIQDLSDQEDSLAIVRAVVGLGRVLGMSTTAEGVETVRQLDQVREEGCDEVQGYLLNRPMSAEAAAILAAGSPSASGSISTLTVSE